MSAIWFPTDEVSIYCDDPGYGRVVVVLADGRGPGADRDFLLAGHELGRALRSLTEAALGGDHDENGRWRGALDVDALWPMTPRTARALLPALQAAVITAAAGTDRAERTLDTEEDGVTRLDPLCVNCDVGVIWSGANPHPNPWCEEHGHRPFGSREHDLDRGSWERAWQCVRHAREWATPTTAR